MLKNPDVIVPDQVVDGKRAIPLGGTRAELVYTGRNHSDSSLVVFLPKEKILFAVDFNSLGAVPSRLAINGAAASDEAATTARRPTLTKPETQKPGTSAGPSFENSLVMKRQ